MQSSMLGKWEKACFLIIIAAIFDALDGRFARMLDARSSFGANLDSLCDFANFGIFPAMIVYNWSLYEDGIFGWSAVMISALCAAIRLARFNTQISASPHPVKKQFFEGVPSPAAGILILLPLIISSSFGLSEIMQFVPFYAYEIYVTVIALAMVSTIPTLSLKNVKIPKKHTGVTLVAIGIVVVSLIVFKLRAISFYAILYVLTMPLTVIRYRKLMKFFKSSAQNVHT